MKRTQLTSAVAALATVFLLNVSCGLAQEPAPAPAATPNAAAPNIPPPPPGPGQGGGDRADQFRQRMNEMIKTSLKATDDEWSVIQPLLEKVQTKQRETLASRFGAFGGRRGGGDRPDRSASPETDALKAALESESTSPADIKAKLEAVRAVRKKATADLDQAREELRKVLTQRQEASLVMLGILE